MLKIRLFERSIIPKRNYHGILKCVQVNRAFMKVFFFFKYEITLLEWTAN